MDLAVSSARLAAQRVHVLVVEVPGWGGTRMRVERELSRRGWVLAASPAEADALLVCGDPGPELAAVCDHVWEQLPGPRARVSVGAPGSVNAALDSVAASLLDGKAQRQDAGDRLTDLCADDGGAPPDASADGRSGAQNGDMDCAETDHAAMNHGDMEMDMPMPGGIGLAEGGPDRDGLNLDVLNVPLGPVLLHWPAGLALRCALQGDVITDATVDFLVGGSAPEPDRAGGGEPESSSEVAKRLCLRRCDGVGRLLSLAGAERLSAHAFGIRNALLDGAALDEVARQLRLLTRRVGRSWMLRWSLSEPVGVWASLMNWLREALAAAEGTGPVPDAAVAGAAVARAEVAGTGGAGGALDAVAERSRLESLAEHLRGLDLAAARLVVAAADVDIAAAHVPEAHRG